ncbi:hypothetical protein IP78_13030 [Brevundimonas sp. AAP58]|uniref:hypothetical protein n=1 Tax=Brevundimonas sp. AAP58 TaxID=1523422 RepID=UPI0006BA09B8|nr:hypothetical protein [Brevundimonas sp. AAP58]KPF76627.1 hypothetical protein IP78_13030 [Brevundimonas sp. AAP58]
MTHTTHVTGSTQLNPLELDGLGGNYWDHARREYLAGVKATLICQKYGISLSSFRMHARAGGWRRIDQRACEVPPEFGEYHPDDEVSFADLADQAFLNIRRALGSGRAAEASTWMRVYDRLADRARSEVMAELPDIKPPLLEDQREPLRLAAAEDDDLSVINVLSPRAESETQHLDSLNSVSQESNPANPLP